MLLISCDYSGEMSGIKGETAGMGGVGNRVLEYGYELPPELVAQVPSPNRSESRLMSVHRAESWVKHGVFGGIVELLGRNDVFVVNNSRVFPARLRGIKRGGGARVEMLLLEECADGTWWAMIRPGKRMPVGMEMDVVGYKGGPTALSGEVMEKNEEGHGRLRFWYEGRMVNGEAGMDLREIVESGQIGETPLPPYIQREWDEEEDPDRYQTVYASRTGSVAAPTAGLHWTPELLEEVRNRGVKIIEVTLHVGAGTFLPVKTELVQDHRMHTEWWEISREAASDLNGAIAAGKRMIAVGTTSLRVLESAISMTEGKPGYQAGTGKTDIFIHPPYGFRAVGGLVTNFHLPHSTLLMLISAFADPGGVGGLERVRAWYAEAIAERYRFFSYGDAMFIQ
jgi:S-adenosylmethionine:tRNA ribosyltransferase-isomerase